MECASVGGERVVAGAPAEEGVPEPPQPQWPEAYWLFTAEYASLDDLRRSCAERPA